MKMHPCTPVDLSYFEGKSFCYQAVVEVDATPEQVFASFEDASAWPAWAMPITNVEWTSAKPYGLGTTRRVSMMGNLVGDEVFIGWDYPKRMAFCFTHCSQTLIDSFGEDYQVSVLPNGKTRVQWTMRLTPKGFGKFTLALSAPFMGWSLQWMLNGFKKYIEANKSKY